MGADYLEQDIVLSKDNVPIVIHDIHLETVTDVELKFPEQKRKAGKYYVIDFTFKELQQLNVSERFDPKTNEAVFPNRFPAFTSTFKLHSLQEEIKFIQGLNKSTGKILGFIQKLKNLRFTKKKARTFSKYCWKY